MNQITEESLSQFLESRVDGWKDVEVSGLQRLPIGASRETYRFDARYTNQDARCVDDRLILRKDPPASHVESERRHEFESYRAVYGHGIPVPRMILLEEDASFFGGAISIAEDIRGFHNSEYQLQEPQWRSKLPFIATQMWGLMGKLATIDVDELNLGFMQPATRESSAEDQLNYWVDVLERHAVAYDPITEAAIRHLRRNPPPAPVKLAMVHGDFRAGNFLYDDEGKIHAVLDWEMAHLGDPLEDLGWSITKTFCFGKDDRRSGLAVKDEAVAIWEEGSGLQVDAEALLWWELFSSIKAQALWSSTADVWARGENKEVVMAYASWWLRNSQNKAMLELMGKL